MSTIVQVMRRGTVRKVESGVNENKRDNLKCRGECVSIPGMVSK